ncbi:hypothetical protein CKAH01_06798 [Colletotrichum kahawae]|uniref:Uncharacterized protein n=1 Tax=Colletotrichum kahawae TaxID=34407 RepID=A0AAD9Y8Q2_COLKA|nr:hypothetical protein CKAH01_06798 [Colletotrichum kahawae]
MNNHPKEDTPRWEHEVGTFGSTYPPCFFFFFCGKFPPPSIGSGKGRYECGCLTLLFSWVLAPASHFEGPSHQLQFGSPMSNSAVRRQDAVNLLTKMLLFTTQIRKDTRFRTSHSAGNWLLHGGLSVRRKHPRPNAALQFPNANPPFFLFPKGPSSRLVNPKKAPPSSSHVFFFFHQSPAPRRFPAPCFLFLHPQQRLLSVPFCNNLVHSTMRRGNWGSSSEVLGLGVSRHASGLPTSFLYTLGIGNETTSSMFGIMPLTSIRGLKGGLTVGYSARRRDDPAEGDMRPLTRT